MPKKNEVKEENAFTKQQIIKSNKFKNRIDVINTILEDGKLYTIYEVNEKVNRFLKRKV